jgi:uncharacterized DUF497 family protein
MRFTWNEAKRKLNIQAHGFDFVDAPRVFDGPTFTYEDDRFDYPEQRFVTFWSAARFGGIDCSYRVHATNSHYLFPQGDET